MTFADKMTFPQVAAWLNGSLYVMSPPGLWKLTDTTGSGVADKREMLMSGFDHSGNAADVHGPFAHPNGRLYWCHRRNGHKDVSIAHAAGNALAMKPTTDATPALLHRGRTGSLGGASAHVRIAHRRRIEDHRRCILPRPDARVETPRAHRAGSLIRRGVNLDV